MEENYIHNNKNHWLLRVSDGRNFRNSLYPFWSVKRGRNNTIKGSVKNITPGDILWFITNKSSGGKAIGMAEFVNYYDVAEEPTHELHYFRNSEQGWFGPDVWDIQIHYKNMYNTDNADIDICIQCSSIILNYETFKEKINHNLYEEYNTFVKYGQPYNIKCIN